MASPFSAFRKYQKTMIALLAVLCMLGFVVLPAVMKQMSNRQQSIQNPVMVTTRDETLRKRDLDMLLNSQQLVRNFFHRVTNRAAVAIRMPLDAIDKDLKKVESDLDKVKSDLEAAKKNDSKRDETAEKSEKKEKRS